MLYIKLCTYILYHHLSQVDHGHKDLTPKYLGDYCDSHHFSQHQLFSSDNSALQLILYYDELELCNPLGSRRKKHKIGSYVC